MALFRSITSATQELVLWIAGGFVALGYLGFLPRITQGLDTITVWAPGSNAELLGIFQVSILHNLVHLAIGVCALLATSADRYARAFLALVGAAMMMLVMYGRLVADPLLGGLVPTAAADAWLHGVLGVGMFVAAVVSPGDVRGERRLRKLK